MRFLLLSTVLTLLVFSSAASAQAGPPSLEPGAWVRVTRLCGSSSPAEGELPCRVTGRLLEVGRDSLVLGTGGRVPQGYRLDAIDRLEIRLGRKTHTRRGALAGAVVGGLATYVTLFTGGSTAICDQSANQDAAGSGACVGILALGGLAGAGLGALVGGLIHTETWQDLPIPGASVGMSRGRGLQVRVQWGLPTPSKE